MSVLILCRFILISVFAVACFVSILASQAFAFDGKRKGFVLGFGAGAGNLTSKQETSFDLPRFGVQTDLKLGVGVSDRVLIHYTGKQSWPTSGNTIGAFPLLGVTYYVSPADRAVFVSGGLGAGLVAKVDIDNSGLPSTVAPAAYLGAGYEFARHYSLEFDLTGRGGTDVTVLNLALTLNALAF